MSSSHLLNARGIRDIQNVRNKSGFRLGQYDRLIDTLEFRGILAVIQTVGQ